MIAFLLPALALGAPLETVVVAPPANPLEISSPANVEVISREQLRASPSLTLQGALQQLLGANLNDQQGNPFQTDLTLRGMKSSSVTGLSQGLAVFVDGVRVNEADADEVNFNLIPLDDVEKIEVVRGPVSLGGRNLAGSIYIVTQRGTQAQRVEAEAQAGSFEHEQYHLRSGLAKGKWDLYASASFLTERGYRAVGSSEQARAFVRGGYHDAALDMTLSYQLQRDALYEPGSLPISLYETNRSANFTAGDRFAPLLHQVTYNLSAELGKGLLIVGSAYGRFLDSSQFNANADGPDTEWVNRTQSLGVTLQLRHHIRVGRFESDLTVGAEAVHHQVGANLSQHQNASSLANCLPGCPLTALTTVLADSQMTASGFVSERARWHFRPERTDPSLTLIAGVRFDSVYHDILDTSPIDPGAATGRATFQRFLPAAEMQWDLGRTVQLFASYQQGFRPPAFLELTCANPSAPCPGLQAGVAPDPSFASLRPIWAQTFEAGVRAHPWQAFSGQVTLFRTDLHDDIYAVAPTPTTLFFQNVGSTRRQGVELAAHADLFARVQLTLRYTYTLATFETALKLATPRLDSGIEQVAPGDSLPMIPQHVAYLRADAQLTSWATLSVAGSYVGAQYYQGDEANQAPRLPGYFLLSISAQARWNRFTFRAAITNATNTREATFGTWSQARGSTVAFLTPGEPVRATGFVSYDF